MDQSDVNWNEVLQELTTLNNNINSRNETSIDLILLNEHIELAIHSLIHMTDVFSTTNLEQLLEVFRLHGYVIAREISGLSSRPAIITGEKTSTDSGGRPKSYLKEETLIYFREVGYSWKDIATMLNVSRWTIYRRVQEFGIGNITGFSNISNDELDQHMLSFKQMHGITAGRSLAIGYLRQNGLKIQQDRVAKALVRVDPGNSSLRRAALIKRRKYSVPGPNSLWHIDGHHSLVNWGFVIHGGIDGFSRYIVFLQCSTNNRKETVSFLFEEAITKLGIPSRVRTDKGGENVLIWERITELRGIGRGSYLAGSSVHNQRIERLWRDVWNTVCSTFYYTFQAMQDQGLLDCDDEKHLFILHYIFLPRINQTIQSFTNAWNMHPIRTEHNWCPTKIWTNGMIDSRNRNLHQISELQNPSLNGSDDLTWYGMDWYAPSPRDDGLSVVEVEDLNGVFCDDEVFILHSINPLSESNNFGIDIFVNALHAIGI